MNPTHPLLLRSSRSSPASPRAEPPVRNSDVIAQDPLQNRILAALPAEEFLRLLPLLEPFALPAGWTVYSAGQPQAHIYFITSGVVSRVCVTEDGKSAEFATTGREGVIGVSLCLGGGSMSSQAIVVAEGFAFRLRADLLMRELGMHGALMELLLRHVQCVMAEIGQVAACNRHHSLQSRLCRWLLALHDRVSEGTLPLTHDLIAYLLGVRREGVSHDLGKLEQDGLIRCHRGHLDLLDRAGLEAKSCECYSIIRRAHDCLRPAGTLPLSRQ